MRIGIVTGEYPPMQGGVGAYTHILAQEFAQLGHQVQVFSSSQAGNKDVPLANPVMKWNWRSLRQIKQWAAAQHLDVISLQFQTAAYQMSPWIHFLPQYLKPVPVITTFHDLRFPYLFPKAGKLRNWIVRHLARTSAGVIATNHEDLLTLAAIANKTLIPIGSNILTPLPKDFNAAVWRKRASADTDDFLIAYFGFINRSKGVDELLSALHLLIQQAVPCKLIMIGGHTGTSDPTNAAYFNEIEQKIAQLGLQSAIHWTGYVHDEAVSAYLAAADGVALPFLDGASYRRGTLMAAIYHHCAIVTTEPQSPIANFVTRQNMLLVPPGNAQALAQALGDLYNSPDLQQTLREGVQTLTATFDWRTIAQQHIQFFETTRGKMS